MTTAEITKHALTEMGLRGAEAWRNNNIAVRGRTFIGRKGVPYIIGFVRATGVFVMCEVKNRGDKLSQDQIELLNMGYSAGCVTVVATVDKEGKFLLVNYKPD
jgi:hypothetical protein